jgi:hypothetical protein
MTTHTYSWGEFFETVKACDDFEEQKEKFAIFEALDKATTKKEIRKIVKLLTQEQINWLNSPCLDGIIATIQDPENAFLNSTKEFLETFKYYQEKNLIHTNNDS